MGAEPENTFVFLAPTTRNDDEQAEFDGLLAEFKPGRMCHARARTRRLISFWRKELRELAAQRAR